MSGWDFKFTSPSLDGALTPGRGVLGDDRSSANKIKDDALS